MQLDLIHNTRIQTPEKEETRTVQANSQKVLQFEPTGVLLAGAHHGLLVSNVQWGNAICKIKTSWGIWTQHFDNTTADMRMVVREILPAPDV